MKSIYTQGNVMRYYINISMINWKIVQKKQKETFIECSDNIEGVVNLKDIDGSIQNLIFLEDFIVEKKFKSC